MFDKEVVGGGAREVGGREGLGFEMTWKEEKEGRNVAGGGSLMRERCSISYVSILSHDMHVFLSSHHYVTCIKLTDFALP